MKIVRMNKSHTEKIAELEKLCFSSPWSQKALEEELDNPNAVFLVEEEAKGYIGCHFVCDEGAVTNIAVHPDFRRQKIASALIEALEREGRIIGADRITLEVRKSNLSAITLYEKMGYTVCGERPNFYTKPTENAILMELKIRK